MTQHPKRSASDLAAICLLGLMLFGSNGVAHATPAARATPVPAQDRPRCDVAPRSVADILALYKPQAPQGSVPMLPMGPLPRGAPADAETTAAIAAAVQEIEACVNAGDVLRFYALLSDDWMRQIPSTDEIVAETTALATATPTPLPEGHRSVFFGPWHVEELADGRVLAAVVWFGSEKDPGSDPSRTKVLIFTYEDGRWLIDEIIERVADCNDIMEVAAVVGPPPGTLFEAWPKSCKT
jgi:hypothetical protein